MDTSLYGIGVLLLLLRGGRQADVIEAAAAFAAYGLLCRAGDPLPLWHFPIRRASQKECGLPQAAKAASQ